MIEHQTQPDAVRLLCLANSGDEFIGTADVVVEINDALAALIRGRRRLFDAATKDDRNLLEMRFSFCGALYFTNDLHLTDDPVDLASQLSPDERQTLERAGHVVLPEALTVPHEDTRTECDEMIVRRNGFAFSASSRHTSVTWTTWTIRYAVIAGVPTSEISAPR